MESSDTLSQIVTYRPLVNGKSTNEIFWIVLGLTHFPSWGLSEPTLFILSL